MKQEKPDRPRRRRLRTKSVISLDGCQIKSIEVARELARGLDMVEKAVGIHSVHILIFDCFVCPDIDLDALNQTPMEIIIARMMKQVLKHNRERKLQP